MIEIQSEQAFEFLIQHLAQIPPNIQRHSLAALRYAHLYLPDIVPRFWQTRTSGTPTVDLTDASMRSSTMPHGSSRGSASFRVRYRQR